MRRPVGALCVSATWVHEAAHLSTQCLESSVPMVVRAAAARALRAHAAIRVPVWCALRHAPAHHERSLGLVCGKSLTPRRRDKSVERPTWTSYVKGQTDCVREPQRPTAHSACPRPRLQHHAAAETFLGDAKHKPRRPPSHPVVHERQAQRQHARPSSCSRRHHARPRAREAGEVRLADYSRAAPAGPRRCVVA